MMTQHAGASVKLWGWAATHAAFVWNRTHISADTGVTPYEALRGKKPSLKHLDAVWGCDAFCHVPREQRSTLEAKAEPCVYVGHSEAQNAPHVLLLSTKKIICSRDVTFRSDSFSFMHALEGGKDGQRTAIETCETDLRAELKEAEEAEEWKVESIVSQRKRNGRTEYRGALGWLPQRRRYMGAGGRDFSSGGDG